MTNSTVAGLPAGVFISSSESTEAIASGLQILKDLLPDKDDCFFSRGSKTGPAAFMTDDSDAERNAISKVWPYARRLKCIFHVKQACWRWLLSKKAMVKKEDRPDLLKPLSRKNTLNIFIFHHEQQCSFSQFIVVSYMMYHTKLVKNEFVLVCQEYRLKRVQNWKYPAAFGRAVLPSHGLKDQTPYSSDVTRLYACIVLSQTQVVHMT